MSHISGYVLDVYLAMPKRSVASAPNITLELTKFDNLLTQILISLRSNDQPQAVRLKYTPLFFFKYFCSKRSVAYFCIKKYRLEESCTSGGQ